MINDFRGGWVEVDDVGELVVSVSIEEEILIGCSAE